MGIEPKTTGLAQRLRLAIERRGAQRDVAELTGIPVRTLGRYINGKTDIPAENLRRIAEACSVSADWLLTGAGEVTSKKVNYGAAKNDLLDAELFGRVVDAIHRLHREERVSLPPIDLGRLAAEKYNEIAAATDDRQERLSMVKLIVIQLRLELRAAAAEPGTGKASA